MATLVFPIFSRFIRLELRRLFANYKSHPAIYESKILSTAGCDMRLLLIGISILIGTMAVVFGILASAELGSSHSTCSWQFPIILGCLFASHGDLAGGVIGAMGTIFAGWLAWMAVQKQIGHSEKLARLPTDEALHVIRVEFMDFLGVLNQVWRAVDLALQPTDNAARADYTVGLAITTVTMLPPRSWVQERQSLGNDLGPLQRQKFARFIDAINGFYLVRDRENLPGLSTRMKLFMLRTQLTFIRQYVDRLSALG